MTIKRINYPYDLDLVKAECWQDFEKYIHFIIRFHLYIEEYQAESTTYPGEILASFQTPREAEIINAIEKEHSVIKVDETICSNLISEELMSSIQSELMAGLETPLYTISSKVNATIPWTVYRVLILYAIMAVLCLNDVASSAASLPSRLITALTVTPVSCRDRFISSRADCDKSWKK